MLYAFSLRSHKSVVSDLFNSLKVVLIFPQYTFKIGVDARLKSLRFNILYEAYAFQQQSFGSLFCSCYFRYSFRMPLF